NDARVTNNLCAIVGGGISVGGADMTVTGNIVYGGSTGISLDGSGVASGNLLHDESDTGISGFASRGGLLITDSVASRHGTGISVGMGPEVSRTLAHHGSEGIAVDGTSPEADVHDTRVDAHSVVGIRTRYTSIVQSNHVYNNAIGIIAEPATST